MTEPSHAVFLSYASQDAQAALKICTALRDAGIEVWFDQSALRGGDAWDQSIRKQIKTCALFLPVISHATHQRREGYFRLEWKLAVDRCHLMDPGMAFLLPVVIDDTPDDDERVPERFREVQWTRLPAGETPPGFAARVRALLSGEAAAEPARHATVAAPPAKPMPVTGRSKAALLAAITVLVITLGYLAVTRLLLPHGANVAAAIAPTGQHPADSGFNPPAHSIAVLPFVNLSGDKDQEYFSDGLTEEVLNSLAEVDGLQVAARTSAFSFKGQDNDIGTIARKLNVGAVLEGSVRRSAHTVRITVQLINAVTGFHLWSKTYDRDLGDVLKLQTEIATAVAGALKVTLLGDLAARVELGGTHNPAALDAYLRGMKLASTTRDGREMRDAEAAYTEAVRLDPSYALAFAARSIALTGYAIESTTAESMRDAYGRAQADASRALALAPDLAMGHLAQAYVSEETFDFRQANASYERAVALAPGNAHILRLYGQFLASMARFEPGIAAIRRAIVLDPLSRQGYSALGLALVLSRRPEEAIAAFSHAISMDPDHNSSYGERGLAYYQLPDMKAALDSCAAKPDYWLSQQCLSMVYNKLGRTTEAQAEFSKLMAALGDSGAYQYAALYAQSGNNALAVQWLETAWRLRDPGLENLKTDPLLDPLRREPRFQAVERELKFLD